MIFAAYDWAMPFKMKEVMSYYLLLCAGAVGKCDIFTVY